MLEISPESRAAVWPRDPGILNRRGSQMVPMVLGGEDFPMQDLPALAGHPQPTASHARVHRRGPGSLPWLDQALNDVCALPEPGRVGYHEILQRCRSPSFPGLVEVAMNLEHSRQRGKRFALPNPQALAKMEALPLNALEQLAEDRLDLSGPAVPDARLDRP